MIGRGDFIAGVVDEIYDWVGTVMLKGLYGFGSAGVRMLTRIDGACALLMASLSQMQKHSH